MNNESKMSVTQLTILTAVNMMGSGIIMLPAKLAEVGGLSIVSWLVTAIGSMCLVYVFAKCGMYSRKQGGMNGYAEYTFGKSGSFICSTTYSFSLVIANIAIATSAVGYGSTFLGIRLDPITTCMATIGILWLTTPKTHAAHRFVPISTSLWQRLWARIKRLDIGPRDLIFTNSRGNPVRSSTERHNWNKALKAAGLPPVTIHSARHWTASMTARANMPDDARTAIMGHTSISMTNHYTHRDTASLAKLLGQAIPDLHDDMDVIDVQVIDEAA